MLAAGATRRFGRKPETRALPIAENLNPEP
jgi:hypothetical protein